MGGECHSQVPKIHPRQLLNVHMHQERPRESAQPQELYQGQDVPRKTKADWQSHRIR